MKEWDSYCVSEQHAKWFGIIISEFARFENCLHIAAAGILNTDLGTAYILLSDMNLRQKLQTVRHLNTTIGADGFVNQTIRELIVQARKLSTLRNWIAHNTWTQGRRAETIKPMMMRLRGHEIGLRGHYHNEPEYSLDYFESKAREVVEMSAKLIAELRQSGLYAKVEANMEATKSRTSPREGGPNSKMI